MKVLTLVIVKESGRVLLGLKKRGFGAGHYNGFGGKVEAGETIEEAAKRELEEEVGIVSDNLEPVGQLQFSFIDMTPDLLVHLFVVRTYHGTIIETEEMRSEWFPFSAVPYNRMWPDDEFWLPAILNDKVCYGTFLFDRPSTATNTSVIIEQSLQIADSLNELGLKE